MGQGRVVIIPQTVIVFIHTTFICCHESIEIASRLLNVCTVHGLHFPVSQHLYFHSVVLTTEFWFVSRNEIELTQIKSQCQGERDQTFRFSTS